MKVQKIKLALIAAHKSELAPFINMGNRYLIVNEDVAYLACGVGPVAATFGLTHFLEDYRPERIIAVGTAGFTDSSRFQIGDVVQVKEVTYESGSIDFYSASLDKQKRLFLDVSYTDLPSVKVFAPQEITKSKEFSNLLKNENLDVEHLEAYAYAFVAKKFNISIDIILGLVNKVGPDVHGDWKKNSHEVMDKLSFFIKKTFLLSKK